MAQTTGEQVCSLQTELGTVRTTVAEAQQNDTAATSLLPTFKPALAPCTDSTSLNCQHWTTSVNPQTTWPATASGWLSVIRAKDAMAASTEDGPVARRSRLPVALVRWIEGTLRQAETDKDTAMAERTKLEQVRNNMTASAGG
eukprot:TRINITY_DN12654_c2_g2_i9.p1 TRINITY_DN12654_c2_g2~~TRINITY_DN12654_c2_g2_i9.p1  ORF type:complete len:143 (+),score=25.40 TRINITY_DN12654_c2_g2_i9:183-611(+)